MSRWKTSSTARRPTQSNSSDHMEDMVTTSRNDDTMLHLSFLDDMLGGTTSNAGYTSGNHTSTANRTDNHVKKLNRKYSGGGGGSAHNNHGGGNDLSDLNSIDDILDLVQAEKEKTPSSSSAAGQPHVFGSRNNSTSENRHGSSGSLMKYGESSSNSKSGGNGSRSFNKSGTTSRSNSKTDKNSRGEPGGPDFSTFGVGEILLTSPSPQMELHPATFEQAPFFGSILNTEDDDTISQITSSVTSQSLYDSTVDGSRGSYPWLRSKNSRTNTASPRMNSLSQGEVSYADTLDEIADMIGPSRTGIGNRIPIPLSDMIGPSRAGLGSRSPISSRKNPQFPSADDPLFRSPPKKQALDLPLYTSIKSETYRSKAEESYRNSPASSRRTSAGRHSTTQWTSMFEPFLSQFRLFLRYLFTKLVPNKWLQRKVKEERQTKEQEDYFGAVMGGPAGGREKVSRSRHRQRMCNSLLKYAGFFCAMTLMLLISRLTMMHAKSARPHRSSRKSSISQELPESIRGGMTNRKKNVRGGMAHHLQESTVDKLDHHAVDKLEHHISDEKEMEDFEHSDHVGLSIPDPFTHLADITDMPVKKGVDIPFYWHIPRAGGGTVNDIFGECLSLALATDAGGAGASGQETKLHLISQPKFKYVNVDTSTPQGLERAKRLGLAESGIVDVVISTLLHQASALFSTSNRGRMFTVFRHPVERAVSLFHYVQDTQWRRRQTFKKELSDLTIEEYFKSGLAENNWMTRFLTGELTKGELTKADVNIAKEIIRRKCLVGLLNEKGESFARFERYFGFSLKSDKMKECHEKKLQWAWPLKHRHEEVEEGTAVWDLIMSHNKWDMELYDYAKSLFREQSRIFQ